jgi:Icc-related predicted phosphoesterase
MNPRIVAISDIHGVLPVDPAVPPCDILLIAGDVCPDANQAAWLDGPFREWLEYVPARHVVATFGNHDYVGQPGRPAVPVGLRWELLIDRATTVEGLRIYGTPWTPRFYDWHWMLSGAALQANREQIPHDLDILISHGPPHSYRDMTWSRNPAGCEYLTAALMTRKPRLTVCGHIHEDHGVVRAPWGLVANVALPYMERHYVNATWSELVAEHGGAGV